MQLQFSEHLTLSLYVSLVLLGLLDNSGMGIYLLALERFLVHLTVCDMSSLLLATSLQASLQQPSIWITL